MTTELPVRRRHRVPGWAVVHYREVGLPIYRLTLDVVVLVEEVLPAISEFALRAIDAGMTTVSSLAGFLGLDAPDVEDALVGLLHDDLIRMTDADDTAAGDGGAVALTSRGASLVSGGRLTRTREVQIRVDFDGLLRRPVEWRGWLMQPREVKRLGWQEVRAFPPRPPRLTELDVAALRRVILNVRDADFIRILHVARIVRRERWFVPAAMLVYRQKHGDGFRVAFKVADIDQPEHERAFAASGAIERLNVKEANRSAIDAVTAELNVVLRELRRPLKAGGGGSSLAKRLGLSVLETYDHPAVLDDALRESRDRCMIVSPWITNEVVDEEFVATLRALLGRQVRLDIGWGLGGRDGSDPDALRRLERFAEEFTGVRFRFFGDATVKALVCDGQFAVLTSFNWLSFRGDANRAFRDERGYLIKDEAAVAATAAWLLRRFDEHGG